MTVAPIFSPRPKESARAALSLSAASPFPRRTCPYPRLSCQPHLYDTFLPVYHTFPQLSTYFSQYVHKNGVTKRACAPQALPPLHQKTREDTQRVSSLVWCGQQDLAQGGDAKPRGISALLRPSVTCGSDVPPARHSLPHLFKSCSPYVKKQKGCSKSILFVWCGQQDLNLHSLATIRT